MLYSTISIILYYINFNYKLYIILILKGLALVILKVKKIIGIILKIYNKLKIDLRFLVKRLKIYYN